MCDLQIGLGLGTRFGQQLDAGPEPALEQQPPPPVDAMTDYAEWARPLLPGVAMFGPQGLGRGTQVGWSGPAIMSVFDTGVVGQDLQGGHRSGGRSVSMTQGSSCWAYQTASRVQRCRAGEPKAVLRPTPASVETGDEGVGGQPLAATGAEGDVLPTPHKSC